MNPLPDDREAPDQAEASDVALAQLLAEEHGLRDPHSEELRRLSEFRRSLLAATPRVFVTQAIVAVNVAVFLIMAASGVGFFSPTTIDMVGWGANYGPLTTHGQWWRLLSCTFLHFGLIHIFFNMYVLYSAGPFLERLLGNAGFLVLYLLSGLAGSLASVYWNPNVVSAGASGAVFGVFGGLLGYLVRCPDSIPRHALAGLRNSVVTFVGYNLFFGLMVPQIDLMAHAGGFAGGFLCAVAISRRLRPAT